VKYVLDTNAVSGLMKGDVSLIERLRRVARDEVAMPQPVIAEVAYGLARLAHSKRQRSLADIFRTICAELGRCPWTDDVSASFGRIKSALERRGERIEDFDVAIAAHAVAHDAVLITANRAHMARIPGLRVEDWTAPS